MVVGARISEARRWGTTVRSSRRPGVGGGPGPGLTGDDVQERDFPRVLELARAGDEATWTRLYDWLAPAVVGYLRAKGAPHPEDAASEVFLQVVRDIDAFSGTVSGFRSWVFSIAHHRMLDQARKASRRPAVPAEEEALTALMPCHEWEGEAVENLATWELHRLFARATPEQQEVLVLRFVVGLTMGEIAEILDKQVGAVKALQRRGLGAVREAIEAGVYPLAPSRALTAS